MMEKIKQSMLTGVDYRVIPNGIDLSVFHPADKAKARLRLGLPSEGRIVMFVASGGPRNAFKDYPTMQTALRLLREGLPQELCHHRHGAAAYL